MDKHEELEPPPPAEPVAGLLAPWEARDQYDRTALDAILDVSTRIQDLQKRQQSGSASALGLGHDTYKERQARAREDRQNRTASLKSQQRFMLETAANILRVSTEYLLEGVYDDDKHIELMDSIIAEGGRSCVVVCNALLPPVKMESGRYIPSVRTKCERVYLSDGGTKETVGKCVAMYRINNNKAIDNKTVTDDIFYAYMDLDQESENVVSGISQIMRSVYMPALEACGAWGDINPPNPNSAAIMKSYTNKIMLFLDFLEKTKIDLDYCTRFTIDEMLYEVELSDDQKMKAAIKKIDVLESICSHVKKWSKQITMVLVQSEQLRREAPNAGPLAELEYWRRQLVRFTSIIEHVKSEPCRMYIEALTLAKSKLMKKWNELDNQVTDSYNEAADNVKYLYALEPYLEPLYRCDPTTMENHLPDLLYTVRMIYSNSKYFNTTKQISTLLVKVTNQILNMCVKYLTNDEKKTIWNQSKVGFINKANVCLKLYSSYRRIYDKTRQEMIEAADEKPFNCSEMAIFGKLVTFKSRLEKIIDLFQTYIKYNVLTQTTIEGIEEHSNVFVKLFKTISSKSYDALAHRKPEFDKDYTIYKDNVANQEILLENFMITSCDKCPSTEIALHLLSRFEKLELECLYIEEAYYDLISKFTQEIEYIRDRYMEERDTPEIPWNMPAISGRIFWIRFYFSRIQVPMKMIQKIEHVIKHMNTQRCIKLYNVMYIVCTEYERLYHRAWVDNVGQVRLGLASPLLIRHPQTNLYIVNFSLFIPECIRDVEYMFQLRLSVPDVAQSLAYCKDRIYAHYENVKYLVERNNDIRRSIPKLYLPLMRAQLIKLEKAFQAGMSIITWTSLEIPSYCENIQLVLDEVELFIREVIDMKESRIDGILKSMASTILVYLPDRAVEPSVFLDDNLARKEDVALDLQAKSWNAELAVVELIEKFISSVPSPNILALAGNWLDLTKALKQVTSATRVFSDDAAFKEIENLDRYDTLQMINECNELFAYFNQKVLDALIKCTRTSLDTLRKRASVSSVLTITNDPDEMNKLNPLMLTRMLLKIPQIMINPSLDEIQQAFTQVILQVIMDVHKSVFMWGQQKQITNLNMKGSIVREKSSISKRSGSQILGIRSFFRSVSEHKDIVRTVLQMQGNMYMYKPDIEQLLQHYERYSLLWSEDRPNIIQNFVDSDPIVVMIRDQLKIYESQTEEVLNLPDRHIVGSIQINTENLKLGLHVESIEWKRILGRLLCAAYRERVQKIMTFIKDRMKTMAKKLKDLDDVRIAMICLEMIREEFIGMDMELDLIEETYSAFRQFGIDIPTDDANVVDGLRYAFRNMLSTAAQVQQRIVDMQGPLQMELTEGVATFNDDVIQFDKDYEAYGPMVPGLSAREASDRVILFQSRFDDLWRKFEMYANGEKLFGMEVNDYPILHQKKKEFNLLNKLYSLYLAVMNSIDGYFETPWNEIDIETIVAQLSEFDLRCRKLPKGMKEWPAFIDLKKKIDDFNETCPLLELMADKSMKDRHWSRLEKLMNVVLDVESDSFLLADIMECPLLPNKEDVEDICISAVKEKDIEAKLKQVMADWAVVDLKFTQFKNRGELLIRPQDTLDIITLLEDSLMILNSLASNRYNAPFKKDIITWIQKLQLTSEILEKWLQVQNLWMYLEAVFVGGDIAKQLPAEAKRFGNIDKTYVKIMYRARDNPNVVDCCSGDDTLKQMLPHLFEQLEACQKSLTGYLETKRAIFPRFFFVSDPVLLEILGQASNPHSIQPHLPSLFDAMYTVDFDNRDRIVTMNSDNGEKIPLDRPVQCTGGVEIWLNVLLDTMRDTVRNFIATMAQLLNDPEFVFLQQFPQHAGQAGLLGMQLLWTGGAEYALKKAKVDKYIMRITNQKFLDLLNGLIEMTVTNLTPLDRTRVETMITIHVHQRDIFDDLVRMRIKTPIDFEWQKQARFYYLEESDDCTVSITDVDFLYQNEYLGITERLVITPLTDRCYITLAQAIGMSMGGAPAGPAGTGKTETTKDMGRTLGKLVIVFNCSDQMDFRGLGRIYKGLAQSGTWGCFDEFNRVELPVLSVAAQQIYICLTARREKKESFIFSDGDVVPINPEFAYIITMNPGYAGRQELPENLKIQFRSVAMMVPDRQIIIRVKLASCGFKENIILARKFFTLYKLCEEQLSKQVHYDFGLRNILSVLRTMGAQKRANPDSTEESIMMRVLKEMNVSKLVDEDEPLFISLIEDLFPGSKITQTVHREMQKAVALVADRFGLVNHPEWNLKIIQLYETSLVRHGLMTMGPTGSGKTSCIHTLMGALTEVGKPHKEMRMNPKAITAPQMFGRLDVATNDWTDGIFSTLWRRALKVKKSDTTWIVLDGPVDAVWIENLNSVLDDNKTLTLANGDRITMAQNSKLVFEPDNVDNASPATVSRMGMVFLSSSVLKWQPILEGWLKTRSPKETEALRNSFNKVYDDVHSFVQQKLPAKMKILEALYVRQCLDVLTGLLQIEVPGGKAHTDRHLERLFIFSMMWSLGAVLEIDARTKMTEFMMKLPTKMEWPKSKELISPFEFMVNESGVWQHWAESVDAYEYPTNYVPEFASILVPNIDNVCTAFLIDTIAKQNKSVLLIGEQGTAKTVMLKGYMTKYDQEVKLFKMINFSFATTPNLFQRIIESYVEKRVGTTYGPPGGKSMTVFIDDINMPVVNEWGDQVTNEIVRQLMEQGGFYSLEKPGEFTTIADIQIFGAMIHPGGGRNDIPPRLKRQMNIFNCTLPSLVSMDLIFHTIGSGYFSPSRFDKKIVSLVPKLVPLTRIIWQQTKVKMLPTPAKFHYVFNLRDLSRIWEGMLFIKKEECSSVSTVLKLWFHECLRVISDRFTTHDDKDWFVENLKNTAETELGPEIFEEFPEEEKYFVNFLREPIDPTGDEDEDFSTEAPKIYEELPSWEFVLFKLKGFQELFNEQIRGAHLDLVFFLDAMVHLFIISRIINTPRGNALLVGVGGSGKQSLTKLASFIANFSFYQITLTRAYNVNNFLDDIKILYRIAGLEGRGVSFIFTDNDIKDEQFLEFLNNILSSGEIANLFAKDEMDEILNDLTPIMKKFAPRRIPVPDVLYEYFIMRSRANLHLVLCFSPVGEKFRSRALKFPGLISGCTMDWFQKWPREALIEVASHFLSEFKLVCSAETKTQVIEIMGMVQDSVSDVCSVYFERFRRQTHVTPKSYLSFLDGYKVIYKQKHENIAEMASRMSTGLTKLVEAAKSVDELKKELEIKELEIKEATAKAEEVLAVVAESQAAAEEVKAEVMQVKDKALALVKVIAAETSVAEVKLAEAKPALDAAEAALQTINAADIATVRKLGKPPFLITLIMDAVCILFQKRIDPIKPDPDKQFLTASWADSLKVMADVKFLSNLKNYPKDEINEEMIDLLQPYFNYSIYTYENAKIACGNVAGLISWTLAMAQFFGVNKHVLPLKANLAIMQAKYQAAKKELDAAEAQLASKERELAGVQKQFDEAMALKQGVLDDAAKCQQKMDAASALINGLSGERVRWTEQSALFKSEIERLVGDVLLLTGFLSYSGPFNQEFRLLLNNNWLSELIHRKIPVSMNLNITDQLTDSATIGEWNLNGLPNDELSVQNGIIVTKASRYPLLIDPQTQGKIWIKNMEKYNELIVTTLNHKYFRNHLEDCVSLGRPLLIEDVGEELDPVLDNILERNYIKIGSSFKVKLGDKEIDVMSGFRIYITTKLPNPAYTPEISARTSIIDFTVTMSGLEDQLLGRVILTEKKELETERTQLITDVTANKRKMQELEANLLHKLTTIQGSLVEDVSLIQVLNVTKATATEVKEKLDIARETEIKINAAREEFRGVATRGSVLYFLVCNMSLVCPMYQTSLAQFLERFDISMERSDKSPITHRRINFIIDYLTFDVFKFISRGFYEKHKYLFTLLLTLKIDQQKGYVSFEEFQNLIKGGAALDLNACPQKPFKWITDMSWLNLVQLSTLRQYSNILSQVTNNEKGWKNWFDKESPEDEPIPDGYNHLDVFRKLLVVRAWCPDRTMAQSLKYVISSMGVRYSDAVIVQYEQMVLESRPLVPLIGFLAMGSDPTPSIEITAKRMECVCSSISMGQGQEIHARKLIDKALVEGMWVLLQNCHLGLDYMVEVLELFMELEKTPEKVHESFRLWITTEVHPKFSISLLQLSIKYTNEPPSGIKAGLMRTYDAMSQDFLDYSDSPMYLPLIYTVSFLHTVVQERRKFGPLGWNIPYEFNSSDWLASCMFIQNHLDDLEPGRRISWTTVRYMISEVQYGGRVTDDYDKRLLVTFARSWFTDALFTDDWEFYKSYSVMHFKNIPEYLEEIERMKMTDPPQAYGLHTNADITYQRNTTQEVLDTILSIQPKEASAGGGETREMSVLRQSKEMLEKVPADYDPHEVRERLRIMGSLNSMVIFLRQEIDRMQKVISLVRTTLKDLLLAIEGTIIMNEALRDSLDNIYDAKVPNIWLKSSWSSSTLGFWFTEFLERNIQFSSWCFVARPPSFWMTGFFNPQGFLTAMRQEVTRAHKGWALDMVSLHNDFTKWVVEDIKVPPQEGVYIHGLFLDGAGWDRRNLRLCESTLKVLYTSLPVVHTYAINSTAPKDSKLYTCPVYKKPVRTGLTYITPLWLPTIKNPDHWVLRGVAILCDIK